MGPFALATGWSRDLLERVGAGSLDAAVILLVAVPQLDFPLTVWSLRRGGDADLAPVLSVLDRALGARLSRRRDLE